MSRVPVSWSIAPATMNKLPLKVAWFNIWNNAAKTAASVPKPSISIIIPNWLIVEKARMAFKSVCRTAI